MGLFCDEMIEAALLCFWQLAYEIDQEVDDQNEYLDGMVRPSGVLTNFTFHLFL